MPVIFPLPSADNANSSRNSCKTNSSPPFSAQINGNKNGKHGIRPQLSDVWRDIQGAHNWNGLLHPFSPILKSEALRYGHFAQLCYDAFDFETCSIKCYGTCKYNKSSFFQRNGMSESGYQVTKYIYGNTSVVGSLFTEKSQDKAVWLGFIAVCTDPDEIRRLGRRDIVIAWRGTQTTQEWIQNLKDFLVPARLSYKCERTRMDDQQAIATANDGVRFEGGFLTLYTSDIRCHEDSAGKIANLSARDLVMKELMRLLKVYESEIQNLSLTFTGHSLGAALAILSAYDIKNILYINHCYDIPVSVFSFASPRVGNLAFSKQIENIGVKVLRFVNKGDVVPKVPVVFVNEKMGFLSRWLNWLPWTYFHVGVEVFLDNNSSFLMRAHNLSCFHNLNVYLDLIEGYNGGNQLS